MTIIQSIMINADMESVWEAFADLPKWKGWCRAVGVSSRDGSIRKGLRFRLRLRLFWVPLRFKTVVEEVSVHDRVVWSARKLGIRARHEFLFTSIDGCKVILTSRETFRGFGMKIIGPLVPKKRLKKLTRRMLEELKRAAERRAGPDAT
ncbi:MAG TPA: SRPBCC family protein [Nitrospirota bacterium]|nr:SRPBCC family protein [Nitrospirota bacterium]